LITMFFTPSMEPENSKYQKFVTGNPWKTLQSGNIPNRVPFVIGSTDSEGSFYNALCNSNIQVSNLLLKTY